MKRIIALVFAIAVLLMTVLAAPAGAVPGASHGQGGGTLGPGNGMATPGSCANSGMSHGADFKC